MVCLYPEILPFWKRLLNDFSCRGAQGVLGARNAPLRHCMSTVQRTAAGSLRVSPRSFLPSPKSGGPRGMTMAPCYDGHPSQVSDLAPTLAAGFVSLYPPCNGALYPLGRAEGLQPCGCRAKPQIRNPNTVQRNAAGSLRVSLSSLFFSSPKIGGPKGVERKTTRQPQQSSLVPRER